MQDWLQIFEFALDVSATVFAFMLILLVNIGLKWLPARNQMTFFLSLFLIINLTTLSLAVFANEFFYRLYVLVLPGILLLGPLMTRFTRSTISMQSVPLLNAKIVGLYVTGLALITPYLLVPTTVTQLPLSERPWILVFGLHAFVLLFVASSSMHFGRMIIKFYRGSLYSLSHSKSLYSWLKGVWFLMMLIWLTLLFNTMSSVLDIPWETLAVSLGVFDMLTGVISLFVLFSLTIFTALYCKKPLSQTEALPGLAADKYEKSALSEGQAQEILQSLEDAMQTEKYFLDSCLNIDKLAQSICTPPQYLSQAINQYLGMNFYELVANYRIAYAKELLLTEPDKSVLAVAMDAGFNAKSTFNQTFKKVTGLTPSAFKKMQEN